MFEWVEQLFQDTKLCAPIFLERENQFNDTFCNHLDLLIARLKDGDAPPSLVNQASSLSVELKEIIAVYYRGNLEEAQARITNIVASLLHNPFAVSHINDSPSIKGIGSFISEEGFENIRVAVPDFFRARISHNGEAFMPQQMLHIRFSEREKVSTQRFSVPGLPCIYLCTSTYGCWTEMGRPADNTFCVSAIKLDNCLQIFNLGINDYILRQLADYANKNRDELEITCKVKTALEELFPLWMLSYASSFKIQQCNMQFRSDYIIPQMLMLAVKKFGLNGVAYFSKQNRYDHFAFPISVNVTLFADYNKEKELSQICKFISVSRAINYSEFKQLYASSQHSHYSLFVDLFYGNYADIAGRQHSYNETEFHQFDKYLLSVDRVVVEVDEING